MSTKSGFLPPLTKLCHDEKQDEAQACLNINELKQKSEILTHANTDVLTIDSPDYLYNLCSERKWNDTREHLKRSDLSNNLKKEQIQWKDENGSTALHMACFNKPPVDIIQSMITIAGNEIVLITDNFNVTALHEACLKKVAVDVAKLLIEVGRKELVMTKSKKGKCRISNGQSSSIAINSTALHLVCENGEIEFDTIRDMVEVGRKDLVLVQNFDRKTALHQVCYKASTTVDVVKLLIHVGETELLMKRDKEESIAFHIALERASVHEPDFLKVFVDAGDFKMLTAKDCNGEDSLPLNQVKYLEEIIGKKKEWKDFFIYFYKTFASLQNDEFTNLRQQQDEINIKHAKEIKEKNRIIEELENATNNGTDEGSSKKPRLFTWSLPLPHKH